ATPELDIALLDEGEQAIWPALEGWHAGDQALAQVGEVLHGGRSGIGWAWACPAMTASPWAAHCAQAASARSTSRFRSPLVAGAAAGSVQGLGVGQVLTISVGAGEGGAAAQPSNRLRQRQSSPIPKVFVL